MSIEKAKEILREPVRVTTHALYMMRLEQIIKEALTELEAVQEAQSKPEPGEFTKEFRSLLRNGCGVGQSTFESIWEFSERACDIIDRQAEQLAAQKAEARKYGREITEARQGAFGFMIRGDETLWQGMTRNYQEFYDERERLNKQLAAKDKEIRRLKISLTSIQSWANAYPLAVFPKPDLKKAAEVLRENGMTLDAINADAVRGALDGIKGIVDQALKAKEGG